MNLGLLIVMFIAWPVLELAILWEIHDAFGFLTTLSIVVVTGILGASLAKMQGISIIRKIQKDLHEARMPAPHIVDGVMILIAGVLLITPGLLTDLFGFSLLIPPVRALIRKWLMGRFRRKFAQGSIEVQHWEC